MDKENKKELITYIVDHLKEVEELPYKDGAWEKFHQQHHVDQKKSSRPFYWIASAAAVLIIAFFGIQQFQKDNDVPVYATLGSKEKNNQSMEENKSLPLLEGRIGEGSHEQDTRIGFQDESSQAAALTENRTISVLSESYALNSSVGANTAMERPMVRAYHPLQTIKQIALIESKNLNINYPKEVKSTYSLALSQENTLAQVGKKDLELSNKKFQFNEHFDLGMFVAPNNTNDKFNFGGGLLLGYKLNKHLSVRTGLSFNKYEVGKLKDPISNEASHVELSNDAIQEVVTNGLIQRASTNALILPNMNAVTGNIQSLEVPLEFKLTSRSGFYATSGLTYAMVLDQDRMIHYFDNSNAEVFPGGLPSNGLNQELEIKPVSKSIKTSEKNIKTSGFGGFVNFSLGKEVKVNKTMSLSVEPYMKLPVGNFRAADMNYTHGGIRIITNF
ncbi:hypothetical protein ACFRAE_04365 [Sphingobacterium sp. HJSM2_6]|uniref:hypothetical protein n=1 Tax=Sphingobacterium sp. HJSM2_6 TaxID=3366264 RepID=UPI003BE19525